MGNRAWNYYNTSGVSPRFMAKSHHSRKSRVTLSQVRYDSGENSALDMKLIGCLRIDIIYR